jgi:RNA polymerase sigma-70 factor (ECF subfamily)
MEGVGQLEITKPEERTAAFARFVAQHRDRALRLAWRLAGGDGDAAEDITQDALVRAWRGLDGFRSEAALGTWFYRILVRQAANHRRWRGLRERFGGWGDADAPDPRTAASGDPVLRARIARALDALPRGQREVFVLVHLEQFTVDEAAAILHKANGTVKSHLARALRTLRSELADLAGAAENER